MTLGNLADLKSLSAVHQLSNSTCIIHLDNYAVFYRQLVLIY